MGSESTSRSTLPTQAELKEPILRALRELGGVASNDEIAEHVVAAMRLSVEQCNARRGSAGSRTELAYRLAWARTRLKQAGMIAQDGPKRWKLR